MGEKGGNVFKVESLAVPLRFIGLSGVFLYAMFSSVEIYLRRVGVGYALVSRISGYILLSTVAICVLSSLVGIIKLSTANRSSDSQGSGVKSNGLLAVKFVVSVALLSLLVFDLVRPKSLSPNFNIAALLCGYSLLFVCLVAECSRDRYRHVDGRGRAFYEDSSIFAGWGTMLLLVGFCLELSQIFKEQSKPLQGSAKQILVAASLLCIVGFSFMLISCLLKGVGIALSAVDNNKAPETQVFNCSTESVSRITLSPPSYVASQREYSCSEVGYIGSV